MLILADPAVRAHLYAALSAHAARCRRDAIPLPAELEAALRFLASTGQARPPVGDPLVGADHDAMTPLALDYRDTAERLGVSDRTVRRLVRDGRLPAVRIGGVPRVRVLDLEQFVADLEPVEERP